MDKFIIVVFAIFMATFCGSINTNKKTPIDIERLAKNKHETYNHLVQSKEYTYCGSENDFYNAIYETDEKRIIAVCLAVNSTSKFPPETARYFKYWSIDQYGDVKFCGWRDITYTLNKNGNIIHTSINADVNKESGCKNFNINTYNDR